MPSSTRPITVADLEQVIAIDKVNSGQSRRHFFEKRFAAAKTGKNMDATLAHIEQLVTT